MKPVEPRRSCGFHWPLKDPNEEDKKNLVEHRCRYEADHEGGHKCLCGARPEDDD